MPGEASREGAKDYGSLGVLSPKNPAHCLSIPQGPGNHTSPPGQDSWTICPILLSIVVLPSL